MEMQCTKHKIQQALVSQDIRRDKGSPEVKIGLVTDPYTSWNEKQKNKLRPKLIQGSNYQIATEK